MYSKLSRCCFILVLFTTIISRSSTMSTKSSNNSNENINHYEYTATTGHSQPGTSSGSGSRSSSSGEPQQQQQQQQQQQGQKSSKSKPPSSSFFVLCLTDGTIVSIEAWTGIHQSVIHTDPVLQTHYNHQHEKNDNDIDTNEYHTNQMMILPGANGRLYYRPQQQSPVTVVADDTTTASGRRLSEAPPLLLQLQELPITIDHLLENPVRSCQPIAAVVVDHQQQLLIDDDDDDDVVEMEEECGILTATTETSLFALSAQTGTVQWRSGGGRKNSSSRSTNTNTKEPVLLLQRKDHLVQYVQINNGQQLWNVSLGNYQALDFDVPTTTTTTQSSTDECDTTTTIKPSSTTTTKKHGGTPPDRIMMIDSDDDVTNDQSGEQPPQQQQLQQQPLPAIVFQNDGQTLVAVNPMDETVLWRQDVPSTLANVFGIAKGKWQTIPIITTTTATSTETTSNSKDTTIVPTSSQGSFYIPDDRGRYTAERSEYERFLWNQRMAMMLSTSDTPDHSMLTRTTDRSVANVMNTNRDDVDDTATTNPATTSLCWIDEYEHWGSCLNDATSLRPLLLTLPSGPPPSYIPVVAIHSNGVLLSWSIIMTLIVVLLLIVVVVGRFWYLRKKAQWMILIKKDNTEINHNNKSNKLTDQNSSSSTPPQLDVAERKSSSGNEGRFLHPSDRTNSNDTNSNALDGTIPLVRYSRYVSEYQELRPLGKGGFGSVFQCKNTLDGREYAIKKVSIYSNNNDHFQRQLHRVLREVKILAVLDHPNIVRYYTAWLEIEEGRDGITGTNTTINDESTTRDGNFLSHRRSFSSSMLFTGNGNDNITKKSDAILDHTDLDKKSNPLGWNNGLDLSDNSSLFLSRRQSLRDFNALHDEFVIFEDSHEGDIPHNSIIASLENSSDSLSQKRNGAHEEMILHSERHSISIEGDVRDTSTFSKQNESTDTISRTLYIQMQLCSQKTLAEFLSDGCVRSGSLPYTRVDVPKALRIFVQIADAAAHVHECGLIHRDLKPNNCFMDDSCTTVKVGDFGLSRESKSDDDPSNREEYSVQEFSNAHEDHTAGVGTRSYASPEQMNGSDYDSSSDVYSLGMILFELLYAMNTGMERQICFGKLRDHCFPDDWATHVGTGFPTIKDIIINMLSRNPSSRPTAEHVTRHIQSILGEFTLMSLDENYHQRSDIVLLRVEAENRENALQRVVQMIQDETIATDLRVEIVQYGMRSTIASGNEAGVAIMEFALRYKHNSDSPGDNLVSDLVPKLLQRPEIIKARLISNASTNFP